MKPELSSATAPTLVVPDVHLRLDGLIDILSHWGDRGPVVMLGDFFDDFNDTVEDNVKMAIFLKERVLGRGNYTVIMGNHDLHYHPHCPPELCCSGFHPDKHRGICGVLSPDDFLGFKWAHSHADTLFTHAGLHPRLMPAFFDGGAGELAEWIGRTCQTAFENRDPSEPLLRAGRARGGYQPVGGVIWMDAREYQPVHGIRQVFGHTPMRSPLRCGEGRDSSWCIDTNSSNAAIITPMGDIEILRCGEGVLGEIERLTGRVGIASMAGPRDCGLDSRRSPRSRRL